MSSSVVPSEVVELEVIFVQVPQCQWATPTSQVRDNWGGFPLPPEDHARSILSHLAYAGGAAPAATSLGSWEGTMTKCLGPAQSV